jgi:uncharacterized protein DUF4190/zinc ribbon protein
MASGTVTCPNCGSDNQPGDPTCRSCGHNLGGPSAGGAPPAGAYQSGAYQSGVYPAGHGGVGVAPPVPIKTNTNAVVSLVTGILSIVFTCFPLGIVGLACGVIGKRQIRESNGTESGNGIATAGIITSIIGILTLVLIVVLILAVTLLGTTASSKFSSVGSAIR